jgi:2-polyprenyl-3-methyl-5-hydroxy-6-metoxy-1,4-benzoquinol methylase
MLDKHFSELLNKYTYTSGEVSMPCVPALLETYMGRFEQMFSSLGKPFSQADLAKLREILTEYLQQGFKAASNTYITLKYHPTQSPDTGVSYTVSYNSDPNVSPPPNNRDLQMRVPAMLGVKSQQQTKAVVQMGGKTATLQVLQVDAAKGLVDPVDVPSFLKNINLYTRVKGEILMPCTPALMNVYMQKLEKLFKAVGKAFNQSDLAVLRNLLKENLDNGFKHSPLSRLVIKYESALYPNVGVTYNVAYSLTSIAEQYQNWVDTRKPPLFGKSADARVMDAIASLGDPATLRALDIGAGTGRNILPLAKLGCKAEALELAPALVKQLTLDAQAQGLDVKAIAGDILDPQVNLQSDHYHFIVCAEVVASHFRNVDQIKVLLEKVSKALCHGGLFLFNLFIAHDDYVVTPVAQQFSEVVWSSMFTNQQLHAAFADLPLEIIGNDSVCEYEHKHLPDEDWPPTGWFENWTQGKDLFRFSDSQMELRWILAKRI